MNWFGARITWRDSCLNTEDRLEVRARQYPELHAKIPEIDKRYGETIRVGKQKHAGFWHSKAAQRAADAQVVAVANVPKVTAASDDAAVKLAWMLEGVPCVGWSEFARRLGLIKLPQLALNLVGRRGGA